MNSQRTKEAASEVAVAATPEKIERIAGWIDQNAANASSHSKPQPLPRTPIFLKPHART